METATELERRVSYVLWSFSMRTTFPSSRSAEFPRGSALIETDVQPNKIFSFSILASFALYPLNGNSLNTGSIGESERERAKREGKREREKGGVSIDRHGFSVDYLFAVHGRQMQHPVRGRLTFNTPVQRCGNSCV